MLCRPVAPPSSGPVPLSLRHPRARSPCRPLARSPRRSVARPGPLSGRGPLVVLWARSPRPVPPSRRLLAPSPRHPVCSSPPVLPSLPVPHHGPLVVLWARSFRRPARSRPLSRPCRLLVPSPRRPVSSLPPRLVPPSRPPSSSSGPIASSPGLFIFLASSAPRRPVPPSRPPSSFSRLVARSAHRPLAWSHRPVAPSLWHGLLVVLCLRPLVVLWPGPLIAPRLVPLSSRYSPGRPVPPSGPVPSSSSGPVPSAPSPRPLAPSYALSTTLTSSIKALRTSRLVGSAAQDGRFAPRKALKCHNLAMELHRLGLEVLHQILPGTPSSVGKQYSKCSVASAGAPLPNVWPFAPSSPGAPQSSAAARVSMIIASA
jgi:hypothetical protein